MMFGDLIYKVSNALPLSSNLDEEDVGKVVRHTLYVVACWLDISAPPDTNSVEHQIADELRNAAREYK